MYIFVYFISTWYFLNEFAKYRLTDYAHEVRYFFCAINSTFAGHTKVRQRIVYVLLCCTCCSKFIYLNIKYKQTINVNVK